MNGCRDYRTDLETQTTFILVRWLKHFKAHQHTDLLSLKTTVQSQVLRVLAVSDNVCTKVLLPQHAHAHSHTHTLQIAL
jgi:hypothetical protein